MGRRGVSPMEAGNQPVVSGRGTFKHRSTLRYPGDARCDLAFLPELQKALSWKAGKKQRSSRVTAALLGCSRDGVDTHCLLLLS